MTPPSIRDAGDAAVLIEWPAVIDVNVNARAVAVAESLRSTGLTGVRDVVATFRSVAVYCDPLGIDRAELSRAIDRALSAPVLVARGSTVEVPVVYGGPDGPDLEAVARWAELSVADVVARHVDAAYRVFMLGFLPGFAYLGLLDEAIAAPRLETPRMRVPAGSVGVAGRQTGAYPRESPGGWRLIGRTMARLFDPGRLQPALLKQGDTVRFVPVRGHEMARHADGPPGDAVERASDATARAFTVLQSGPHLSVQDTGRHGHQRDGVSVAGAMDTVSHRLANAAVGNDERAATVEVTLGGPMLRVEAATVIGIAGGDLGATIDHQAVRLGTPVACGPGSVLRFGGRGAEAMGTRAYVAFDGGVAAPSVLGSRSTHARSGLGGVDGRALRAGDRVPLGLPTDPGARIGPGNRELARPHFGALLRIPHGGARVRVIPGPQDDWFVSNALDVLESTRFTISSASDRMGYRLTGGHALLRRGSAEMISDATFVGAVQVPPSGDPIVLMADRPVTGGYPQIATVITADLPVVAQLGPGHWIEFERCSRAEAVAALAAQEAAVRAIG